jgi:hypothetical protein
MLLRCEGPPEAAEREVVVREKEASQNDFSALFTYG